MTPEHLARWLLELEARREFPIINALASDPRLSVEDAIKQICDLTRAAATETPPAENRSPVGDHCYYTACSIFELGARTPGPQQAKLIALVNELEKTTVSHPTTNEPMKHDGRGVWTDLPTFGYTFADELGSVNPNETMTPEKRSRWENATAFVAQLTKTSATTDFSPFAMNAFTCAFGPWRTATTPTDDAFRAASLWFVYASDRMWKHAKNGEKQFDRTTWRRWGEKMVERQAETNDEETKKMIDDALAELWRVEED